LCAGLYGYLAGGIAKFQKARPPAKPETHPDGSGPRLQIHFLISLAPSQVVPVTLPLYDKKTLQERTRK